MKLVIGGYAQGKLNYVLQKYKLQICKIYDGEVPKGKEKEEGMVVINHFHNWVKEKIANEACPEEEILGFIEKNENCVIISDEIGNGIVPMEVSEREYRERTGRLLVELAKKAEEVERVLCGIGQKIK